MTCGVVDLLVDSGARIRTRKRNIAVPLDKGSFADTVVTLYLDSKEDEEGKEELSPQHQFVRPYLLFVC